MPVSRRRVFNAMNTAINNNFERIISPRLESGQYKVKSVYGFTRAKPKPRVPFRVPNPNPVVNPATPSHPTPGTNPAITCDFFGPAPGEPHIFHEPNASKNNKPAGPNWKQQTGCFRGLCVVVDEDGIIVYSSVSGTTTNGLDLVTLLQNSGKAPTSVGEYSFVFEFFGWKRTEYGESPTLPNGDPNPDYYPAAWVSDDSKYKIYNGSNNSTYKFEDSD